MCVPLRHRCRVLQLEKLEDKPVFSVMFSEKSLGMKVSNTMPLTVVGWNDLKSGLPGEAEKIGSIHVGDVIVAVNGEKTDGYVCVCVCVCACGCACLCSGWGWEDGWIIGVVDA